MSTTTEITKETLEKLAKFGKAVVVFTVGKHPDDGRFDDHPPHVDLYIKSEAPEEESADQERSTDSKNDERISSGENDRNAYGQETDAELQKKYGVSDDDFVGTIAVDMDKADRTFVIVVESLHGKYKRWREGKPKRESKTVRIVSLPNKPWRKYYAPTSDTKKLKSGTAIQLSVVLSPRSD